MSIRLITLKSVLLALLATTSCAPSMSNDLTDPGALDRSDLPCPGGDTLAVRWIKAGDKYSRRTNAQWCASVGPVVVEDFVEAPAETALDSLVIVSWNTHVGGGDLPGVVRRLRQGEFTGGKAPLHFIVLLQEVHREGTDVPVEPDLKTPRRIEASPPEGDRIDIIETARDLGLVVFYVPSMRNGKPGSGPTEEDRGNAILSTLPLSDLTAIELPFEKYRRVAAAATISGQSTSGAPWRLRLCTAHLATRTRFPRFFSSAGAGRLNQAKALVAALPETPAALGGDFNTWTPGQIETTVPYIRRRFRQPERLDDRSTLSLPFLPDRRVDYLLFRLPEGLAAHYHRLEERYGSDHYPLIGWVQLASPTPADTATAGQ